MTRSEMFKKAHEIARNTKEAAGSYRIAFACALKDIYAGMVEMSIEEKLEAAGAYIWERDEHKRAYLNIETIENLGFKKESSGKWSKNGACISSRNMDSIISRAFFDCIAKEWNFSRCNGGFSTAADRKSFVENAF